MSSKYKKYYWDRKSKGDPDWWKKDQTAWRKPTDPIPNRITPCLYDEVLFVANLIRKGEYKIEVMKETLDIVTLEEAQEIYEEAIEYWEEKLDK